MTIKSEHTATHCGEYNVIEGSIKKLVNQGHVSKAHKGGMTEM